MVGNRGGFLLDANVVYEIAKAAPNRSVVSWLELTPEDFLFLSVITIGEIRRGIDLLSEDSPRRAHLQAWLDNDLRERFGARLLPFDAGVAERWGQVEARAQRIGNIIPTVDAQLAATALHHGLTFVTRNIADIEPTGVPVFNPWGDADR